MVTIPANYGSNMVSAVNASQSDDQVISSNVGLNPEIIDYLGKGVKSDSQHQYVLDEIARQFNSAEAQKNRDWEERMSNTAWQRGVQDMLAAGLNPALAYTQGSASSPSGFAAQSGGAGKAGSSSFMGKMVSSLMNTAVTVAGLSFGKAIGSRLASSQASALAERQLTQQIHLESIKSNMRLHNAKDLETYKYNLRKYG